MTGFLGEGYRREGQRNSAKCHNFYVLLKIDFKKCTNYKVAHKTYDKKEI